ncbi:DUF3263 domain-containing protein [Rhodococcus opacus]|uniref:DUF3263 domain-containing protein n=1 Tax=Rhodococcus opacus TaxID=37919 RepID=UPI00211E06CC|nr:DUF3263 domain-containing protein [Rhodococcus opacus]
MDRNIELLEFARRWKHWGGGPEGDIFVTFGLSAQEYFRRVHGLLDTIAARYLTPTETQDLKTICLARLGRHSGPCSVDSGASNR